MRPWIRSKYFILLIHPRQLKGCSLAILFNFKFFIIIYLIFYNFVLRSTATTYPRAYTHWNEWITRRKSKYDDLCVLFNCLFAIHLFVWRDNKQYSIRIIVDSIRFYFFIVWSKEWSKQKLQLNCGTCVTQSLCTVSYTFGNHVSNRQGWRWTRVTRHLIMGIKYVPDLRRVWDVLVCFVVNIWRPMSTPCVRL